MTGLKGARVLIVDNEEKDAIPIIKAFSKAGIPSVFIHYDENTPENKLKGIRLVVLDMELETGLTDSKSKASTTANYLSDLISSENGPYFIIAWTNYPELLNEFEGYIFSKPEIPNPIFSIMITKSECRTNEEFDLGKISRKINEKLNLFYPLNILQIWEEACYFASTEVTNHISDLIDVNFQDINTWRQEWKNQLVQLIRDMATEGAGQKLNKDNCISSFFSLLNPLYEDKMEIKSTELKSLPDNQMNEIINSRRTSTIELKSKINTQIHLSFESLERFEGGNVYIFNTKRKPKWIPDIDDLINAFIQKNEDKTPEKKKLIDKQISRLIIEINPQCDHAQNNIYCPRFIYGIFAPEELRIELNGKNKKIQFKGDSGFIKKIGPFWLDNPVTKSGVYYLFLSARHLVTCNFREIGKINRASVRLRKQLLNEVQYWFSTNAARPGISILK